MCACYSRERECGIPGTGVMISSSMISLSSPKFQSFSLIFLMFMLYLLFFLKLQLNTALPLENCLRRVPSMSYPHRLPITSSHLHSQSSAYFHSNCLLGMLDSYSCLCPCYLLRVFVRIWWWRFRLDDVFVVVFVVLRSAPTIRQYFVGILDRKE
jgi:hypothetical protein